MTPSPVEDLDTAATLAAVSSTLRWRRAGEVEDLRLAAHWADLHSVDPRPAIRARGERVPPWTDRLVPVGGPGTPEVLESAVAELGVARQIHPIAAGRLVGDALDLRHRLPLVWAVVRGLETEVWLARKVAALTRALSIQAVGLVDAAESRPGSSTSPAPR